MKRQSLSAIAGLLSALLLTTSASALPLKPLAPKAVTQNPYVAASESGIHEDCYNTDTTDEVLPLGIYPEINVSFETTNANASPAIFYDSYGHAVVPMLGGIAIRDIDADETKTLGFFSPAKHDGGGYMIQSSYSFVGTGGFRIYPDRGQQGTFGYIAADAIEAILQGETPDLSEAVYVYDLLPGEGAENGIAAHPEGTVILTNLNCYLLRANGGVEVVWCTPYESDGAKASPEGSEITGAIVYDNGSGTVSTIVCNWFGAGSPQLAAADSDSSIQSYANIYDLNWVTQGNKMIVPGVERMDTIKTENGYEMKSVWSRNDLRDTSIMKLSTATGYVYGYVQDLTTGMWQFIMLDFDTGETVFAMDVSSKFGYNNMAIGMYAGGAGNSVYCPTGYLELLRLQDRFVYLPEMPYRQVNLDTATRKVLRQDAFEDMGGQGQVMSWLYTVNVENVHPNTTVALRMTGLSGKVDSLALYARTADGTLVKLPAEVWHIQEESGVIPTELTPEDLYEVHIVTADNGSFDLKEAARQIQLSVVLSQEA